MTKEEAIRFSDSKWYRKCNAREITALQLYEPLLVLPEFSILHTAVEESLGMAVTAMSFGLFPEVLKKSFEATVPDSKALIEKMQKVKEDFIACDKFNRGVEKLTSDADIHTSPDFQCDQTGGFPTSLCVNWEQEKAWLELNHTMAGDTDISEYEKMCADFGIRQCSDAEQFNDILRELGEDAIQSAELFDEDEGQAMDL